MMVILRATRVYLLSKWATALGVGVGDGGDVGVGVGVGGDDSCSTSPPPLTESGTGIGDVTPPSPPRRGDGEVISPPPSLTWVCGAAALPSLTEVCGEDGALEEPPDEMSTVERSTTGSSSSRPGSA